MTRMVFLAGEGPTELGGWYAAEGDRPSAEIVPAEGVLEVLLQAAVAPLEFQILDAEPWRGRGRLSTFRRQAGEPNESLKIRRLAMLAEKQGCDTLVFVRDRDSDPDRETDVEEGIATVVEKNQLAVVGGVAIEAIESWLLSIRGRAAAERLSNPKDALVEQTTEEKVAIVRRESLKNIRADATSLRRWLERAHAAFHVIFQ